MCPFALWPGRSPTRLQCSRHARSIRGLVPLTPCLRGGPWPIFITTIKGAAVKESSRAERKQTREIRNTQADTAPLGILTYPYSHLSLLSRDHACGNIQLFHKFTNHAWFLYPRLSYCTLVGESTIINSCPGVQFALNFEY